VRDLHWSVDILKGAELQEYLDTRYEIPFEKRRFFEGIKQITGEMLSAEREVLFNTVKKYKPKAIYEVGTRYGGGSTYFSAQALWENGRGVIHTIEIDPGAYVGASANYAKYLGYLSEHVKFYCGDGATVLSEIIQDMDSDGMVTLDGGSDENQIVNQYNVVLPHMKAGSILVVHDWGNEKTNLLRPIVENDPQWVLLIKLEHPISAGFRVYQRKIS